MGRRYDAILKMDNITEKCIDIIGNEVQGKAKSHLIDRATDYFDYEDDYSGNTAIIAVIYKNSRYTKVLHADLSKMTVKVCDAYVIDTSRIKLERIRNNLIINYENINKNANTNKDFLLEKESFSYIHKCIEILKELDLYKYIPDKQDIVALSLIPLY